MATPPAGPAPPTSPATATPANRGVEVSAESPVRGTSALGVSGGRDGSIIDLTTSLETGSDSEPASRTSPPLQLGLPGDTTSDANLKSGSAEEETVESLKKLVEEQAHIRCLEHSQLAQLIALALSHPLPPSDPDQRQAILDATSVQDLVDTLHGQYETSSPSAELAQMKVELQSAAAHNQSLERRLGTSLDQVAELKNKLEVAEREASLWKREVDKSVGLITSLRKAISASGAELKVARDKQTAEFAATYKALEASRILIQHRDDEVAELSRTVVERDEAYKVLQGVAAKHFQQLQEVVLAWDSNNSSHKLIQAQRTIREQRETILRQKRIIRHNGFIPMHDPHVAVAAGTGLDVPGMDPKALNLNARLCRLLAEQFPEVMQIPDGEDRTLELRIHSSQPSSATSSAPAANPASSVSAPTTSSGTLVSSSVAAPSPPRRKLPRHRVSRSAEAFRKVRKDKLTPSQRLLMLSHPSSPTAAGPRKRKPALPPLQPYAQPLPGEEGYEEKAALVGPPDPRLLVDSDSDSPVRKPRSMRLRRLSSAAKLPATQSMASDAVMDSPSSDEAEFDFGIPASGSSSSAPQTSSLTPSTDKSRTVSRPTSSPSRTLITASAPMAVSVSPPVVVSTAPTTVVSIVIPTSTPGPAPSSSASLSPTISLESTPGSPPAGSSPVVRLLACQNRGRSSAPVSATTQTPLTSPSGRPLRTAAATARQVNAQLLENLGTSDKLILGLGDGTPGPGSTQPSLTGSPTHPLELSSDSGRSRAGSDQADGDSVFDDDAPLESASQDAPVAPTSSLGSQLFGPDDRSDSDDSDSADVSRKSPLVVPSSLPQGKARSYLAVGRAPPGPPSPSSSVRSSPRHKKRKDGKKKRKHKHKHKHKHRHKRSSRADQSDAASVSRPTKKRKTSNSKQKPSQPSDPTTSGLTAASSAAVSTSSSAASSGSRSANPAKGSSTSANSAEVVLPPQLRVTLAQLRVRALQSASRDSRITPQLARLRDLPFFHAGSQRCWSSILSHQSARVPTETLNSKSQVKTTLATPAGIRTFMDVFNPKHPFQQLRRMLPSLPSFFSPTILEDARTRLTTHARPSSLMESLGDLWVRLRGDLPPGCSGSAVDLAQHTRYFVAMCERSHWLIEASVLIGLHPSFDSNVPPETSVTVYNAWVQYRTERKRRSDGLRALIASVADGLHSAATVLAADGLPAPRVDAELYFDPSVPLYPLVNLPWVPDSALWSEEILAEGHTEPWRSWWLVDPASHPFNTCFRARNPEFMVFHPKGMDSRIVEDSIDDDVELAEADPSQLSPSTPSRENRAGIFIFEDLGDAEVDSAQQDSGSDDGLGSPNLRGASPSTSLFGPDSPSDSIGSISIPRTVADVASQAMGSVATPISSQGSATATSGSQTPSAIHILVSAAETMASSSQVSSPSSV